MSDVVMFDGKLSGLAGKVAVVTGAGRMRSIGRPIALSLARWDTSGADRQRSTGGSVSRGRAGCRLAGHMVSGRRDSLGGY